MKYKGLRWYTLYVGIYLGLDWFCFVASEVDQVSALEIENLLNWISKLRIIFGDIHIFL